LSGVLESFRAESERVLREAEKDKIVLRLMGALAFVIRCPNHLYIHQKLQRILTDTDYAAYSRQNNDVERLFMRLGYEAWSGNSLTRGRRLIFEFRPLKLHCDVFLDRLEMCHDIEWNGRLERDRLTIPLVELLLEKMQIVRLTEKDVVDTMMLLAEYDVGESDDESINSRYLANLCCQDWGLWRTVTTNLKTVLERAAHEPSISKDDTHLITERLTRTLKEIETTPKTMKWKMRARVGEKAKWYRDVEAVER
jgi:hypothetical protein